MGIVSLTNLPASFGQDICTKIDNVVLKTEDVCHRYPSPMDNCNIFIGLAAQDIFNVNDFSDNNSPSGFSSANDIVDRLFTDLSDKWTLIGTCVNQDVLTTAQDDANNNLFVIAVWKNPNPGPSGHGHIAIVLPGKLESGWSGKMVPNAANFSQDPGLNFVCKRLSGAFKIEKIKDVFVFVRNQN